MEELTIQKDVNDDNAKRLHKIKKSARNLVGLYVGQDLGHRAACHVTARLLELLAPAKKQEVLVKQEQEGLSRRAPTQRWDLEEDKLLMDLVLREGAEGCRRVEQVGQESRSSSRSRIRSRSYMLFLS